MAKKKRTIHENTTAIIIDDTTLNKEDQVFTELSKNLAEIRKTKGVVAYILRNANTATIDLEEPEKLVEYALLSSEAMDSSQEIAELFELGDIESILIEGKEIKTLCMNINGNKISIFMETNTDHTHILKRILP